MLCPLDGYYVLTLSLPFVTKSNVSLMRNGDELTVQVGSYRRSIILPRTLAGLSVKEARFEDEKLRIRFEPKK
jgi:arsenite-transporting ATPase